MRIAVAGGTGQVGAPTVAALRRAGHEPVVLARSSGVDLVSGTGLDEALAGVEAVIDVTNTRVVTDSEAREFFGATTGNLLAAEGRAGVGHHVLLSIVSVDRVQGNAHYAGKRHQEHLARTGPIPVTVLRATQFHEFAGMVVSWTRRGQTAIVPPLLVQPVAAADVGKVLADLSVAAPRENPIYLAGPEPQDLVDMARRSLAARGESLQLIPSWQGPFTAEMAGEVLLPPPDALLAPTTFDAWLQQEGCART